MKNQDILSLAIISFILMTSMFDQLLGLAELTPVSLQCKVSCFNYGSLGISCLYSYIYHAFTV